MKAAGVLRDEVMCFRAVIVGHWCYEPTLSAVSGVPTQAVIVAARVVLGYIAFIIACLGLMTVAWFTP